MNDMSYSNFINGLRKADIQINRKMLSELAIQDMPAFRKLVDQAKEALGQ
jgi:large subunit ribosomal protein L20